ncbi:MAG TPA: DUF4132 domain-containing protein, partial [Myxococcaceae bacterium]|nr:DUF4132 domain-containing protein [Myxococcaceae bacterium]
FAQHKLTWDDKPNPDPLVDLLFTLGGPVHATRAVLLSFGLFVVPMEEDSMDVNHWTLARKSDLSWWAKLSSGYLRSLPRLRELLAARTDDAEYAAARDAAAALRDKATAEQRAGAAFLFPTESNWVHAEVLAFTKDPSLDLIVCSVADRADLERMAAHLNAHELLRKDYLPTLLDGAGPEALVLLRALVPSLSSAEWRRTWAEMVGAINTDEAVDLLLAAVEDRDVRATVNEVALRAPRRALRVLGPKAAARGKDGDPARAVLANVIRRWPAVIEAELADLPEEARRAVAALRGQSGPEVAEAPLERLPPILANPPWQAKKAPTTLPVIADVGAPDVPKEMRWEPGEREAWRSKQGQDIRWYGSMTPQQWEALLPSDAAFMRGAFFALAPEALARKLLPRFSSDGWNDPSWWPAIIARFELDALQPLLSYIEANGAETWALLRPYAVSWLAPALAVGLGSKKGRMAARAVLLRHPEHFAAGLLPSALGKPGKAKDAACAALRLLATSGHEATVLEVAGRVSPEVRDAVSQVLTFDPLLRFPAKPPKLPDFFDAGSLPAPLLKEPLARLPVAAVEALGQMLAFSDPEAPYAGLALVKEACEPKSLARFAWALFEAWMMAAAPSKEAWAFQALGVLGDDECVRKLAPLIRVWPGEAAHARAVAGLDVLAAIGTDVALMYLNGIAEKAKFKGLQQKAQEKIALVAEARGLSRDELADRLVPDLGLDENGSLLLDFGERSFTVGFDEHLKPYVKDAEGARLKDLPKPTKKDDAEKAKAAEERWKALKKDAKAVAETQLLRMELGMCGRRRWDAETFRLFFVQHPLLVHIVRRLVWGVYGEDGKMKATFRVAEDRTFSDAEDDTFTLPDDARVGLPHAMELDETVAGAWGQLLADYELLQPFPQLGRPVYTLKPEEAGAMSLARVKGVKVPTGKVLGLEARGWCCGSPQDAGIVCWMEKRLGDDRMMTLGLDPGLYTGSLG